MSSLCKQAAHPPENMCPLYCTMVDENSIVYSAILTSDLTKNVIMPSSWHTVMMSVVMLVNANLSWVAVKDLNLNYYNGGILLITVYTCYGNLT